MLNDLDRIMVNQLVIMNALRLTAAPDARKDLETCINDTIKHNPRVDGAAQELWKQHVVAIR